MFLLLLLLFSLPVSVIFPQPDNGIITGTVTDSSSESFLENCNITLPHTGAGTVTDNKGNFRISIPYGTYTIKVSFIGYKTFESTVTLSKKEPLVKLSIKLAPVSILGKEVTVTGERNTPTTVSQEIKQKDLERMPTIYNDVLRAVQVLPGVSSNNELSSGYNVRGGNFDDNLIYLNGFEIYRPFLLREGVEENKSLINPDMVNEFRFYNGSFPAAYGDKMSSALEVNYNINKIDTFSASLHGDFLNAGINVSDRYKNLRYSAGLRYANPGLFLNELQTNGDYRPLFFDFQIAADYVFTPGNRLELFLLYADNDFDLTPTDWLGHFGGYGRGDFRGLQIYYEGDRNYDFKTRLYGGRYSFQATDNLLLKLSFARYGTAENEMSNINSEYYYFPDAGSTEGEFLRSASEQVNNRLSLITYETIPQVEWKFNDHILSSGFNIRLTDVVNILNENFTETNDSLIRNYPVNRMIDQKFNLNSYSAFIQDDYNYKNVLFISAGLRGNYYSYNKEMIISPRISINYALSDIHNVSLNWGYYYQPPYYAELRNKADINSGKLLSQKAIHYSAGWEYKFKNNVRFNLEGYYKDLDDIIPYYVEREKTEYLSTNSNEGYAFGADMMVQGEIVEGMNSWLGYGYLDTQEKPKTGGIYKRRLTDQTHTVQVFLQDRIKKHPNWQSHFRMLFGSGYLYNGRSVITGDDGKKYLAVSLNNLREYFMYFRVDMGLSASFEISSANKLIVIAEVLNMFNHRNYGGYRFLQVDKNVNTPYQIPQILSSRFFNVGLELKF